MVRSTGDTNLRLAAKNRGFILQKRRGFCGGLGDGYMIRNAATGETIAGVKYDLTGEDVREFLNKANMSF